MSAPQSALGQLLARGNQMEITIAINTAGRQVNVHEIEVFTQKGVYTRRIMDAMGHAELQQEITRFDGQRGGRRPASRCRPHASARLAARARARLRRASVPAARGRHRTPPARRHVARCAALGARTAPSSHVARSGAAHGAPAGLRALTSQESVPARPAARAAHLAPEHEVRRRGVRPAVEVRQGGPAEGLRGVRRQRLGRRLRALHADVPVQPGGSAAEGALVRVLVGSRRGVRAVRAQHGRRRDRPRAQAVRRRLNRLRAGVRGLSPPVPGRDRQPRDGHRSRRRAQQLRRRAHRRAEGALRSQQARDLAQSRAAHDVEHRRFGDAPLRAVLPPGRGVQHARAPGAHRRSTARAV